MHGTDQSANSHVWPAAGVDNTCKVAGNCTGHIPYGALLALLPVSKGGPDLDSLGLSEPGKRVAEALRDYGMYMHDTGCCVALRTDQDVNSTVEKQVNADFGKIYKYIRYGEKQRRKPTSLRRRIPLAPNCAFDAQ